MTANTALARNRVLVAIAVLVPAACLQKPEQYDPLVHGGAFPAEGPPGRSADASEAGPVVPPGRDAAGPAGLDGGTAGPGPGDAGSPPPDPAAMGPCANVRCDVLNAVSTCDPTTGKCSAPVCKAGFASCDPDPGCETPLDSPAACGRCGNRCSEAPMLGVPMCEMGACSFRCDEGLARCGRGCRSCPAACSGDSCVCVAPNRANLIANGGFDRNLNGWAMNAADQRFAAQDAGDCPGSGSMTVGLTNYDQGRVGGVTQCLRNLPGGQRYNFGAWLRINQTEPRARISVAVALHTSADCTSASSDLFRSAGMQVEDGVGLWRHYSGEVEAPAGIRSATIDVQMLASETNTRTISASADMVYLTPAPGAW